MSKEGLCYLCSKENEYPKCGGRVEYIGYGAHSDSVEGYCSEYSSNYQNLIKKESPLCNYPVEACNGD